MFRKLVKSDENGFITNAKIKGVHDETLIHREIYNPNDYDIIFTRNKLQDAYIKGAKIPLGPEIAICKSKDWLWLPHGYYFGKASNGAEIINCITNLGDMIGKGNKLPSLPVAEGALKRRRE